MDTAMVVDLGRESLYVAVLIAAPMLGIALAVGLLIGIVQAATSINEMTLSFIPKLAALVIVLMVLGSWQISVLVDGATKAEKYNETVMLNISQGKKAPAAPTTNEYMKLVSSSGEVWSYLPEEYAQLVFKYGMQYQSVEITGPKAIDCVQKISNAVAIELKLDKPLIALEFLREQLTAEGVDVDGEIAALAGGGDDDL